MICKTQMGDMKKRSSTYRTKGYCEYKWSKPQEKNLATMINKHRKGDRAVEDHAVTEKIHD